MEMLKVVQDPSSPSLLAYSVSIGFTRGVLRPLQPLRVWIAHWSNISSDVPSDDRRGCSSAEIEKRDQSNYGSNL